MSEEYSPYEDSDIVKEISQKYERLLEETNEKYNEHIEIITKNSERMINELSEKYKKISEIEIKNLTNTYKNYLRHWIIISGISGVLIGMIITMLMEKLR